MAGLVPAIRSGALSRRMGGTSPAMTEGTRSDERSLVPAAGIISTAPRSHDRCAELLKQIGPPATDDEARELGRAIQTNLEMAQMNDPFVSDN
jgi:hypothetical protein